MIARLRLILVAALASAGAVLASACGQKGDLVLPPPPVRPAPVAPALTPSNPGALAPLPAASAAPQR